MDDGGLNEPSVIVAQAQERRAQIASFLGSDVWKSVEKQATSLISQHLHTFERGEGNDAELRGRISALRMILSVPHQLAAAEERKINTNRGKI